MDDKNKKNKGYYASLSGFKRAVPIILFALAAFIAICFISEGAGALGSGINSVLLGLFSAGAYSIPFLLLIHAIFYAEDVAKKRVISRIVFSAVTVLFVCAIEYSITFFGKEMVFAPIEFFNSKTAGGFIGSTVAFGLVKALGHIGVYILAVAMVAIYISFFFANKNSSFGRAVFAVLGFFAGILALIERAIKGIFDLFKKSKEKKSRKESDKKSRALLDDQFFKVDDGIRELKVSEPSAQIESSVAEQSQNIQSDATVFSSQEAKQKRSFSLDYGLENGEFDVIFEKEIKSKEAISFQSGLEEKKSDTLNYGLDQSADSFFTKDFDPFNFSTNEKNAAKPFTKGLREDNIGISEVNRSLSSMSDEEIERERRRLDFEKRKQMVLNRRASEVSSNKNSADNLQTKSSYSSKTVEFNVTNEPKVVEKAHEGAFFKGTFDKHDHREIDAEIAAAHIAEVVEMNNPTYIRSANKMYTYVKITENDVSEASNSNDNLAEQKSSSPEISPLEFDTPDESVLKTQAEQSNDKPLYGFAQFNPYEEPSKEDFDSLNFREEEDTLLVERTMLSPSPISPNTDDLGKAEENTASCASAIEEFLFTSDDASVAQPTDEVLAPPSATSERDSKYTLLSEDMKVLSKDEESDSISSEALSFSFEEEIQEENNLSINNAPILEEGTVFSFGEEEDVEEEEEAFNELPEEEAIISEEIPPEKQNPQVIKQREMFPFLNDSESDSSKSDTADSRAEFDEDISTEEEDEPPFELEEQTPVPTAALVPSKEVKKDKKSANKPDYSSYVFPSIELLGKETGGVEGDVEGEIQENADKLIETLASFNVTASIKGVDRGPRITRYEVVPARGVKVSSVMNLQDDIALGLAAEGIRMEAPIPGKSAIGVEIPNVHEETVRLRELLETEDFVNAKSKTTICIGKDVTGQPVINDIAKMPHLLIAGATGMGKSVCINSLMISMLYKARPDEVKFIMIDPKQVEFTMYNGIPHLLVPVVSDAKQAAGALMWAVEEMDRRYNLLNTYYVRNVDAYNEKVKDDPSIGEPMSRIVIVIDEFADLMLQVRDPVENLVMRIAQKARAAGIHLIIGTQRPAVNVITGTIKANVPSRISCKVASNTDSRTVLDAGGAEKLLNKGDMLFSFAGAIKPLRVQGAFVKDSEVEAIMKYLKQFSSADNYDKSVMEEIERAAQKCSKKGSGSDYDDDEHSSGEGYLNDRQFLDAVELAVNSGRIATSLIQRKLSIGYGKAAKFIDIMEDMGIVGEGNGPKPREVLISADEWREKLARSMLD